MPRLWLYEKKKSKEYVLPRFRANQVKKDEDVGSNDPFNQSVFTSRSCNIMERNHYITFLGLQWKENILIGSNF